MKERYMQVKRLLKKAAMIVGAAAILVGSGQVWAEGAPANAEVEPVNGQECATILEGFCEPARSDGEKTIKDLLKFAISVLSVGIGVLTTIGLIVCAYMIMTAQGNEAQVTKAKTRILEIVIGVIIWAIGAGVILLLVPDEEAANFAQDAGVINIERI